LSGVSNRTGADQLRPLLRELCQRQLRRKKQRGENQDGCQE
jgi:hypothetical protein